MGIFNKLVKQKHLEDTEDLERDLTYTLEFFTRVGPDVARLYKLCAAAKRLRESERSQIDGKKQVKLLEEEIAAWDVFLEKFVMFYRDVALAGSRCKKVSRVLREESEKMQVKEDLKELTHKKDEWVFNW